MGIDLREIVNDISLNSMNVISENHKEIVDIIGVENFVVLCMQYGGTEIYIPTVAKLAQAVRNKKILQDYKNGRSYKSLAKKYDLTEMAVRNIVNS